MQAKDAELAHLREENVVLKKGIAIQNNRQRDAYVENQQLQEVLGRAAEHIHGLERMVQQLRTQVSCGEAGQGSDMYMPPPHGDAY